MSPTQQAVLHQFAAARFDIIDRFGRYAARYVNAKKAEKILKHNPNAILKIIPEVEDGRH